MKESEGVEIGEVFSFLSGLYFRGKLTYSRRFASDDSIRVITSCRGLVSPSAKVSLYDLRAMAAVDIHQGDPRYTVPLKTHLEELAASLDGGTRVVLLGSIATPKYTELTSAIFGERLVFPKEFVGRGDMSRGGLLLRHAAEGTELDYIPVIGATTTGRRPPKLEPTA